MNQDNQFCFVIPTRNSTNTLRQSLLSMVGQSYKNWHAIVVDDCSTDGTYEHLVMCLSDFDIDRKFNNDLPIVKIIRNTKRQWEVANIIKALELVKSNEIVCRLDLDDYLCDLNALEIIAKAYTEIPDLDVAWSSQRWKSSKGITNYNISNSMPHDADPYQYPWVSSHFKTWRKSVLNDVSDQNYRDANGAYFTRIGDQCFMLPALKMARKRIHIPISMYAYQCELNDPKTFQSDDAKLQKEEADYLRKRGFIK